MSLDGELLLLSGWLDFIKALGLVCDRMPKKVRFTLSRRVYDLALDVSERIVDAKYSQVKRSDLQDINRSITKIRILLRIARESQFIASKDFFSLNEKIHACGKMLGGWQRWIEDNAEQI
ncbi:MAG: four helix bundle protein [Oligoflexales bacterium]